jgi:hypothetical protein
MKPLDPDKLTWAVLLARWVEFARSAIALPPTPDGRRLKDSVPDLIMLQAVWFALGHLDGLDARERALGVDRAELLVRRHADALISRFFPGAMPDGVRELIHDAEAALAGAKKAVDTGPAAIE